MERLALKGGGKALVVVAIAGGDEAIDNDGPLDALDAAETL